MGARPLAAVLLLTALACSIEQPVSGPVALKSEWQTITPLQPLKVGGKLEQVFCLHAHGLQDADFENNVVVLADGRHTVEGEAFDDQQTKYPLKVAELGGRHFCLYRAGEHPRGPDYHYCESFADEAAADHVGPCRLFLTLSFHSSRPGDSGISM